ncbi:MAG: O-antigen ligase family protein [Planctomycetota bacterium]
MTRALATFAFALLAGLAVLRPLVSETYETAPNATSAAIVELDDPTPVRTLLFDALIVAAGCAGLIAQALAGRRFRWTGVEWGLALLVVASFVSCAAAGQKRIAINASFDWICGGVACIVLVQLLADRLRRRVLVAGLLATACVQAYQCIDEYFVGFEQTRQHYESIKADYWAAQGVEEDSSQVELFERRMAAREAHGFFPHPNVAGSYLSLCGLFAVGAATARWRSAKDHAGRVVAIGAGVIAGSLLLALCLTKSRGAMVSTVVGAAGWWITARLRDRIDGHRRRVFMLSWVGAALVGLGVVGHGWYHGTLPGASLAFRWEYWTASSQLIADHPWTGVGRENFGRHYLQYKPIQSPEEISNPHNLFVQAASEWGLPGLLGLGAILLGGSAAVAGVPWRGGRGGPDQSRDREGAESRNPWGGRNPLGRPLRLSAWCALLAAVVTVVRVPLLGTDDPNYVYYMTVLTGLIWLAAFTFFAWPSPPQDTCDERLEIGAAAFGVFAFLLHDMINFASFVPATMYTCFVVVAVVLSTRGDRGSDSKPAAARSFVIATPALLGVGAVVMAFALNFLSIRSPLDLSRARRTEGSSVGEAVRELRKAAETDPLDPTPHRELARLAFGAPAAFGSPSQARVLTRSELDHAIRLDPFNMELQRIARRLHLEAATISGKREDFDLALFAARKAVELYPQSPHDWIRLAQTQLEAGKALTDRALLSEALSSFERALGLDNQRPTWETLRRLRPREKEAVERGIAEAQEAKATGESQE